MVLIQLRTKVLQCLFVYFWCDVISLHLAVTYDFKERCFLSNLVKIQCIRCSLKWSFHVSHFITLETATDISAYALHFVIH